MNKKSIAGIGIGIVAVIAILVVLSSTTLAPNTGPATSPSPSTGGSAPPVLSTPTTPAKKSYTLELNETVGIATK